MESKPGGDYSTSTAIGTNRQTVKETKSRAVFTTVRINEKDTAHSLQMIKAHSRSLVRSTVDSNQYTILGSKKGDDAHDRRHNQAQTLLTSM